MNNRRLYTLLLERKNRLAGKKIQSYKPSIKQKAFHNCLAPERMLLAGNQLGKSFAGAIETAYHLTGCYPEWWEGKRFTRPVRGWACSVSSETTRDTCQRLLFGDPADASKLGTGVIERTKIGKPRPSRGVSNAYSGCLVKHISGGWSYIGFKSYEQGRGKFQGETLNFIWCDEEPPYDIYVEARTRTNTMGVFAYITMTPLMGETQIIEMFMRNTDDKRQYVSMNIDEVDHISPEDKLMIINSYEEHERDARLKGIPSLGSGRVFPVPEDDIVVHPFQIPDHWYVIAGLDFGWDHPTAATKLAWDKDSDCVYVINDYSKSKEVAAMHVASLKPWGEKLPFAWPHDGLQHDKQSGQPLAESYKAYGLNMLYERATMTDGSSSLEASTLEMLDRMRTNRFKVFNTCQLWINEFRSYHRKDGLIVKLKDDVISSSRYALMMLRYAEQISRMNANKYHYEGVVYTTFGG
jgi:phage terminase large subunit-like protein